MKISYVSDLHLEFGGEVEMPGGDLLLLAGDIIVVAGLGKHASITERYKVFLDGQAPKYKQVLAIVGNHEHYHGFFNKTIDDLTTWIDCQGYKNIHVMNNDVFDLDNFGVENWMVFGSTLWTDYNNRNPDAMWTAQRGLNDHRLIRMSAGDAETIFLPEDAYKANKDSTESLVEALNMFPERNFIVMTHHTPDMVSGHTKWGGAGNLLNYAYHNTQLRGIIKDNPQIKYWVHGHTHDSSDYKIESCNVLCNPRGYHRHNVNENPEFDVNRSIEL